MSGASIQCCKELKACLSLDTSTSVKIWRAERGKLPLAGLLGRSVLLPPPPPLRALASSGEGVARGRNKRRWRGCGDVRGDGVADGAESQGAARRRWIGDSAEQGRCRLGWRQRQFAVGGGGLLLDQGGACGERRRSDTPQKFAEMPRKKSHPSSDSHGARARKDSETANDRAAKSAAAMREEPGVVHDAALQFGHMTDEVGDEAQIPLPGASPPYAVPFQIRKIFIFFSCHCKTITKTKAID